MLKRHNSLAKKFTISPSSRDTRVARTVEFVLFVEEWEEDEDGLQGNIVMALSTTALGRHTYSLYYSFLTFSEPSTEKETFASLRMVHVCCHLSATR